MGKSIVAEWYSDQCIFITGATGFMGKILVEKILRCCPKVAALYVLIRPKKGKLAKQRLVEYMNCSVFDKIRDLPNNKEIFAKLHCISGDITLKGCDLLDQDETLLKDRVTVFFHMAANVRFDQSLKESANMNIGGTLNALELACTFKVLKAFVYVSTIFCHDQETKVEEKLYQAPHNPRKILELVNFIDKHILESITPRLLQNYPNTYVYTKCLTEQLVSDFSNKLPIVITRPSIVIAVYKEPIQGWVDNLNGPTGIMVGAGKGVIRSMHCRAEMTADIIPVDMCINGLIIAAWKVGSEPQKNNSAVYNITLNKEHLISWGKALRIGSKIIYAYPFSVCLWYPGGSPKSNYFLHMLSVIFFHMIPAFFIDCLMILTRNKPFLVHIQKKIYNGLCMLEYYATKTWNFSNQKFCEVSTSLNDTDKAIFYTDDNIDYEKYMLNYMLGARKYCLHEELDTLPYARKLLKRLYYLDLLKDVLLGGLFLWILLFCSSKIFEMFENFVSHNCRNFQ